MAAAEYVSGLAIEEVDEDAEDSAVKKPEEKDLQEESSHID